MRRIDHIVYAVPDLEEFCKNFEEVIGAKIYPGGKHSTEGTHNRIINLGDEIYLEILAIDHANTHVTENRWMGVELIDQARITRWAIKSNDIQKDANHISGFDPTLANVFDGSRLKDDGTMLQWSMIKPKSSPLIEIAPFMVDWKDSIHPTASIPADCRLSKFELHHPSPTIYHTLLMNLGIESHIYKSEKAQIIIQLECPNGLIEIH